MHLRGQSDTLQHKHDIIRQYVSSLKPLIVKWITSINFASIATFRW